jgi:hypothetical protein
VLISSPPEPEMHIWNYTGTADGKKISVHAIAYVIVGHHAHHIDVLRKQYLDRKATRSDRLR